MVENITETAAIENVTHRSPRPLDWHERPILRPAPFMELLLTPRFGLAQGELRFFAARERPMRRERRGATMAKRLNMEAPRFSEGRLHIIGPVVPVVLERTPDFGNGP
jgi:hypothetical protein